MNLLVFNYSMNETSQVFSHQRRIVMKLASHFDSLDVVTAEQLTSPSSSNVHISSTNWVPGRNLRNVVNFYRVSIPLLIKHRRGVVFSHMTEVQSFLISPICKFLRIRHFLWYAHRSESIFLSLAYPFLDNIITSTKGSCPINGKKVKAIGQSIDLELTSQISRIPSIPPKSWYHVGRLDPSKNLELIIKALAPLYENNSTISLHFYGSPSSEKAVEYFNLLQIKYDELDYPWIHFHGQLSYKELVKVSNSHDGFIHAFWGSLDKALLEAILLKRVVVSANPEYLWEFRGQRLLRENQLSELQSQLLKVYDGEHSITQKQIDEDFRLVKVNHSLDNWLTQLLSILKAPM